MARKIEIAEGMHALAQVHSEGIAALPKSTLTTAARFALEEMAERHPGRSVELRIPFCGAVQVVQGPAHRRGTPPNVVEMDRGTWLELCVGALLWDDAVAAGAIDASGVRADLSDLLPLFNAASLRRALL